jgi:hypothetical protein
VRWVREATRKGRRLRWRRKRDEGATDQWEGGPSVPALFGFSGPLGRRKGVGCRGAVLGGRDGDGMVWRSTVMRRTGSKSPRTTSSCRSRALFPWKQGRRRPAGASLRPFRGRGGVLGRVGTHLEDLCIQVIHGPTHGRTEGLERPTGGQRVPSRVW